MKDISSFIDHTILKPTTLNGEVEKLCAEAVEYGFAAVCVPPPFTRKAKELVKDSGVKVCTPISFPFGYSPLEAKVAEIFYAINEGADELDVVINISAIKNNDWRYLEMEGEKIVSVVKKYGKAIKVIIESGVLSNDEIIRCCDLYSKIKVDFLKTSTGYANTGATVEAVELMRKHLPPHIQIKASGGIRDYEFVLQLIKAGATRIGSSAGVAIVKSAVAA